MASSQKKIPETANEQAVSRLYRVAMEQQEPMPPQLKRPRNTGGRAGVQPSSAPGPVKATAPKPPHRVDIKEEIARRERIRNDEAEQDIQLKRITLRRLFIFLALETITVFAFALMQAIRQPFHFQLDEWSFKLLVTATIAQITAMLFVAVYHLFPKNGRK